MAMKNILVTGSEGQLGKALKDVSPDYHAFNFLFTDVDELDITDPTAIASFFDQYKVDGLINCAAYTGVDKAESEPEKSNLINALAPGLLAAEAARKKFTLVHISTDYVFSGKQFHPYVETDVPDPVSVYGISKHKGEQAVMNSGARALIIRTSWLYSESGHNFVKTILRLAGEKDEIRVVFDQIGSPTYARDLAKCILDIIDRPAGKDVSIYNYSNEGVCSWYDLAKAIIENEGLHCKTVPVRSAEYPTPAPRPPYSVLDKCGIKKDFHIHIPWWKDSLGKCLEQIRKENKLYQ
jgi:dTDP-4-dehydrorhamnose reductase